MIEFGKKASYISFVLPDHNTNISDTSLWVRDWTLLITELWKVQLRFCLPLCYLLIGSSKQLLKRVQNNFWKHYDLVVFFPQNYLRNFFSAMLKSPSSPLHIDKVGLTLSKHTICEFSPFFKKGVFDYSSHGTG